MDNIKEKHHALHSFCLRPRIKFDGQNNHEDTILILRAHPITQVYWVINTVILFVTLILLNFIFVKFLNPGQILFIDSFGLAIIFSYIWFKF